MLWSGNECGKKLKKYLKATIPIRGYDRGKKLRMWNISSI